MKTSAISLFTAFIAMVSAPIFCPAQNTFEKKYGTSQYEEFWGTTVLSDTTIVHAGYSGSGDAYIVRTNRYGDTMWTKTISDPGLDLLFSVCETKDNAIITAGRSSSYGAGGMDMYLLKLSKSGQILWRKAIGSADHEVANKVFCCSDKGFLLSGYTRPPSALHNDAYIVKTDSLGNILWTKALGGVDDDNAYSIMELPNKDIVISGLTVNGSVDVMLMKLSASGTVKWINRYGNSGDDRGQTLALGNNGEIYVGGVYQGSMLLLFKTDSMGTVLWSKSYGNPSVTQWGYSICKTKNDNLMMCGYQIVPGSSNDNILIKTDLNGDTIWTRNYGFGSSDYAQSVIEFPGGGYIVSGYSQVTSGDYDLYVIKTDSNGYTPCSKRSALVQVTNLNLTATPYTVSATSLGSGISVPFIASSLGTIQTICEQCETPSTPVDITPVINKVICQNAFTTLYVSTSNAVNWYSSPASIVSLGNGLVYQTPTLTPGNYTYYAEARTCTPSIARVAVTVSVSNCLGVADEFVFYDRNALVYPNPFSDFAILKFDTFISNAELRIFDLSGRKLKTVKITATDKIILERDALSEGIYLYEIKRDENSRFIGKFIIKD